jgi:choice-of-anchor B domain-containing protein
MKKFFITVFTFFIFASSVNIFFAQLGNSNMSFYANKNDYPPSGGNLYSACWGYVAPNGREYAIIGAYNGTAFYDITDTTNIVNVGFISGPTNNWREMKVFSTYCYVVSEASNSKVQIINLANLPNSVSLAGTSNMTNHSSTHTISQEGPYLYLNGANSSFGQGTVVVDATNPTNLVKRGSWNTYYVHDCRVRNDTIWACNIYDPPGTVTVINAQNKDNLTTITSWVNNPNPFPHNCALTAGRTFIFTTDETSTPNGKLKVWNISNLSNVTFVTNWMPTGITTSIVHNVEIYGNYALIAHYTAGVRLIDISNPANPVEVAWYDTYTSNNGASYNGCWGVYMFPSGKIIASDRQTGLYVLKPRISMVGNNNNSNNIPHNFELKQNYPNPFNPSTTIEYSIPKSSFVKIKVYDALGKQVALLADEFKQAGTYKISYDAAKLPSGVYYYSLVTDNGFKETRKMVLSK